MQGLDDLPVELQGCCAGLLGTTSVGRFGQANKQCKQLVHERLVKEKARHARAAPFESFISSRWGEALASTYRTPENSKLIKFSEGGQLFKCSCKMPDEEFMIGRAYSNVARHLASRPAVGRTPRHSDPTPCARTPRS